MLRIAVKGCLAGGCRRLLRDEFRSGRLAAAPKKAEALQDLCDRLGYDGEAALEVHKGIFTERIETFLADKKLSGAPPPRPTSSGLQ